MSNSRNGSALAPMSDAELTRRNELEANIERHFSSFIEATQALIEMRDGRLYRDQCASFEEYLAVRWGNFSDRHGRRLLAAMTIVQEIGPTGPLDVRESHLREFGPLKEHPELIQPTWQQVVEATKDNKLTAALVRRVVRAATEVVKEIVQTGGHITVEGETLAIEAALTTEMAEAQKRQQQHLADGSPWQWQGNVVLLASALTLLQRDILNIEVAENEPVRITLYVRKKRE